VIFLAERRESRGVIVKSAVRDLVKGKANVSEEFLKRLDADVAALVRRAADRARDNNRKTLKARDA
jgi:histone H3/H4